MEEKQNEQRRHKEGSLHQKVANNLSIRRQPLKKQSDMRNKVKLSKTEYTLLQYSYLVWKWAVANHGLTNREINILLYLSPLITFEYLDFRKALKELGSNNNTTFGKMKKEGWIKLWSKDGSKNFYCLTPKANTLVSRMHRMHMMEEQIPTSPRRNVIAKEETRQDKDLMSLFKKFNNKVKDKKNGR